MNKAIVSANADLIILGRTISRDVLMYTESCAKVSEVPLLVSISLPKNAEGLEAVQKSKEFVLNYVSDEFLEKHKEPIQKLTIYEDPQRTLGIVLKEGTKVDCPRLTEAQGVVECEKVKEFEMGDHIVFIGRVLYQENEL